jgi:hypothetical protein
MSGSNGYEHVFPPKRSQVQIQRGVGYVYLRRIYQSNRWEEGFIFPQTRGSHTTIWCLAWSQI